nr:RNA ligase family protein [Rhodococcus sp. (in: high G+C Gram-positive bacteria)]
MKFPKIRIARNEYDNVYGSRKVIKDANNPNQAHYYGTDLWSEYGKRLDGLLPDGFIVFGELIGWLPDGRPIQKGYTYDLPVGQAELYVYRVSQVNPQGVQTDLTWDQTVEFCRNHGLSTTPELWRGKAGDLSVDYYLDVDYRVDLGYRQAIALSDPNTVDEGICIRKEGLTPTILKAKSPIFFQHETKMIDADVEDIEAEAAYA